MSAFYDSVRLRFSQLKMQGRFRDRDFAKTLNPITRKFFMRVGGAIRLTARRQLKKAGKKKLSELPRQQKTNYLTAVRLHRAGKRKERRKLKGGVLNAGAVPPKPVLPERTAKPGKPPLLHVEWDSGTSPLKNRLWFALSDDRTSVLIGPAAIGKNRTTVKRGGISTLRELERRHPFMAPAYKIIEPKIPSYLAGAVGG